MAEGERAAAEVQVVIGKKRIQKHRIQSAIVVAETGTSGEIRVHLSYRRDEHEILQHAQACFHALGMSHTRYRNGVLLYVNPKIRKFALYGDQGIHACVGQEFWTELANRVSLHIREKNLSEGIIHAVEAIGDALKKHFPYEAGEINELSNEVTED